MIIERWYDAPTSGRTVSILEESVCSSGLVLPGAKRSLPQEGKCFGLRLHASNRTRRGMQIRESWRDVISLIQLRGLKGAHVSLDATSQQCYRIVFDNWGLDFKDVKLMTTSLITAPTVSRLYSSYQGNVHRSMQIHIWNMLQIFQEAQNITMACSTSTSRPHTKHLPLLSVDGAQPREQA